MVGCPVARLCSQSLRRGHSEAQLPGGLEAPATRACSAGQVCGRRAVSSACVQRGRAGGHRTGTPCGEITSDTSVVRLEQVCAFSGRCGNARADAPGGTSQPAPCDNSGFERRCRAASEERKQQGHRARAPDSPSCRRRAASKDDVEHAGQASGAQLSTGAAGQGCGAVSAAQAPAQPSHRIQAAAADVHEHLQRRGAGGVSGRPLCSSPVQLLRTKVSQKLRSGPGELRRSFEYFDKGTGSTGPQRLRSRRQTAQDVLILPSSARCSE